MAEPARLLSNRVEPFAPGTYLGSSDALKINGSLRQVNTNSWEEVMTKKTDGPEPQFYKGFGMRQRPQRNSHDAPLACVTAMYCPPLHIFTTFSEAFGVYKWTP